jgi:hypothetical protein
MVYEYLKQWLSSFSEYIYAYTRDDHKPVQLSSTDAACCQNTQHHIINNTVSDTATNSRRQNGMSIFVLEKSQASSLKKGVLDICILLCCFNILVYIYTVTSWCIAETSSQVTQHCYFCSIFFPYIWSNSLLKPNYSTKIFSI